MSKLASRVRLPQEYDKAVLGLVMDAVDTQVNLLSTGAISGTFNAYTAAPTTGTYQKGDFVRNSTPAEAGGVGTKYIVFGFVCTVAGTPGTWLPLRCLTGN